MQASHVSESVCLVMGLNHITVILYTRYIIIVQVIGLNPLLESIHGSCMFQRLSKKLLSRRYVKRQTRISKDIA